MKHLPLTLVGPMNATRPVIVLVGAIFLFGERLNLLQYTGVALAIVAYFLMRHSGKMEGIDFRHNKWVVCLILAVLLGAASGLYDKYLMSPEYLGLDKRQVLSWYTLYQAIIAVVVDNNGVAAAAAVTARTGIHNDLSGIYSVDIALEVPPAAAAGIGIVDVCICEIERLACAVSGAPCGV